MTKSMLALILLGAIATTTALAQGGAQPAGQGAAAAQNAQAPAGNAEKGKQLYTEYFCYSCHASDGSGGAGVRIAPPQSYNALRAYVRKPTGGMPPYVSKVLPDADLADIYAYLRTIPAGPTSKNIPLLNQ